MRHLLAVLLLLATLSAAADTKRKPPKWGQVEVVEAAVKRDGGKVALDGRVRNTGERPLPGLVLLVHFRSTDEKVISTKRGPLDQEMVEPGAEAEFHFEVADPVRAVTVRFEAEDKQGREVVVDKAEPVVIE